MQVRCSGELMFVRFREYNLVTGHKSLRCEVVENYRDRCSGKVRQRSICYLGSVKGRWLRYPRVRSEFWRRVEDRLSALPLSESELRKIHSAIDLRIPRDATAALHQGLGSNDVAKSNTAEATLQPPSSSPAAQAPEQSVEELLADLQRRLGMNT